MKRLTAITHTLVSTALLLCAGCHPSGTWENNKKNWQRACGEPQPTNVIVLHSRYWRSPHFTLEYEYFFEIKADDSYREKILTAKPRRHVTPKTDEEKARVQQFFSEKPKWFIPEPIERYEVWEHGPKGDFNHFRLFIDQKTGVIFFTDYSI